MTNTEQTNQNLSWPEPGRYRRSMRLEFSLYTSALILALMSVTGTIFTQRYVSTVTEGVVNNLLTQARSYAQAASKPIIAGDRPDALMLNNICTKLKSNNSSIYWAGIFGRDNSVLAHTDVSRLTSGGQLLHESNGDFQNQLLVGEALNIASDTIYVRVPINEQGITVGQFQLASSSARISEVRRESIVTVSIITLIMLAIGVPVTMLLTRSKLRPVKLITDSLHDVDMESFSLDPPVRMSNELGFLADTLRVMGRRLNDAQSVRVEKERRDRELEIARDIQQRILPRSLPESDRCQFAVKYQSAREVGGDYYDVVDLGDGRVAFTVADVSGKSLPGMLVMLITRDLARNLLRSNRQPAEILSIINRDIRPSLQSGMFVTMFYAVLDTVSGVMTFASAGHNPLIRIAADGSEETRLKTRGYPLGLMPPEQFEKRIETGDLQLAEGDWVVQYTDGLNEAQNINGDEFGMDRFAAAMRANAGQSPDDFVQNVMKTHSDFVAEADPFDDITLLALRWYGNGRVAGRTLTQEAVNVQ